GDLCYAAFPVLAGHFVNDGILFAEKIIDDYLGGILTSKHQLGLYPGKIGTNDIFARNEVNDFAGALIVGLGDPGSLTSFQLAKTVEQGVSNYLLSIKGQSEPKNGVGISALIIGCDYGGLSVESSLKAIIEGVNNANEKATTLFKNNGKTIQHIEFVEVYAFRALSCMYVLNKIINKENSTYNIVIGNKKIKNLLGIRKRIPLDSSEDWWNRITVKYKPAPEGTGEPSSMVFGASTGDSREEESELYSSTPLIDLFISEVSIKNKWSACTAKTLFELMVPNQLKEKLKSKGNISWILDANTAAYPWELLQDDTINVKPLCINAGMIRQLSTGEYRINIKRVAEDRALVIADPVLHDFINQLPGAKEEGEAVEQVLKNAGYPVNTVINKEAADIVRYFFCNDYTIIHLAGHGAFNATSPKRSGMVIGKDAFLTVFDIQQMPVVPELVFVNCCHLGKIDPDQEKLYQNRYKLAANIGTELIKIGVKAVIAAGWAVDDAAALDFAKVFYTCLFEGDNFGDAVQKARNFLYEKHPGNNTWGAYQCYGDPFFKLKGVARRNQSWSPSYIVPEEAEIHLDNLLNQLQMGRKATVDNLAELKIITAAIEKAGFGSAQITERQALIFLEMAMYKEAIEKFESLLVLENAGFSYFCMEKYCNARAKLYVKDYFENHDLKVKRTIPAKMEKVIKDLRLLCTAGETAERLNLLGSTYKRKAMLLNDKRQRAEAYKEAAFCYDHAAGIPGNSNKVYSVTNAIELECILVLSNAVVWDSAFIIAGKNYKVRSKAEAREKLDQLKERINDESDFKNLDYWDMVASINIDLCLILLGDEQTNEGKQWDKITADLNKLWLKAGSEGKKATELEHLHFLIHALSAINNATVGIRKKGENEDLARTHDISKYIIQLRDAYYAATAMPKVNKPKPAKIKIVKKPVHKKAKR
ncbi:MAG TPA: CHAT domain-containing protein, partial [Agriterribacter sp.]|nr:CHAT domain-containing protein [Agriterribacter sp.]